MSKRVAKKEIIERLNKICAICGRQIKIIIYTDKSYRGGHYFGKVPLYTKKELHKALKAGTRKELIGNTQVNMLKKDPKPYRWVEYWECAGCYWGKS